MRFKTDAGLCGLHRAKENMRKIVSLLLIAVIVLGTAATAAAHSGGGHRGGHQGGQRGWNSDGQRGLHHEEQRGLHHEEQRDRRHDGFAGVAFTPGFDRENVVRDGFRCADVGLRGVGRTFFRNADGSFMSRDAVLARLDDAVANGRITEAQRDFIIERYDFCRAVGGGATGIRCGGFGGGFGRGLWR